MAKKYEKTLGARVAALRKEKGYTQERLADRAGLSIPFISDIENDKRSPGSESLLKLADAFGVSMDHLMRGGARNPSGAGEEPALTFPTALSRAAREEGWSHEDAATILEAREFILARRSGETSAKLPEELTKADWKDLHRFYERLAKNR